MHLEHSKIKYLRWDNIPHPWYVSPWDITIVLSQEFTRRFSQQRFSVITFHHLDHLGVWSMWEGVGVNGAFLGFPKSGGGGVKEHFRGFDFFHISLRNNLHSGFGSIFACNYKFEANIRSYMSGLGYFFLRKVTEFQKGVNRI